MLQKYSISDILESSHNFIPYFVGTFEDTEDPNIEWPHCHSFYSLVWFTQGSGFYTIDFLEYEIKPHRIFLVNTKQIHNWDYSIHSKGYVLMVDSTLGTELSIDCMIPYIDIDESENFLIKNIFSNLMEESETEDSLSDNNIKIGIQYLYSQIRRIAKNKKLEIDSHNTILEQFRVLASEAHKESLLVQKYAEELQISLDELNTICKTFAGVSAKQYLLDIKITEAKRLLLFDNLSISELSFQLGFEDSSYFARIFKKKTGLVPSNFQKKYRKQG